MKELNVNGKRKAVVPLNEIKEVIEYVMAKIENADTPEEEVTYYKALLNTLQTVSTDEENKG